MTLAMVDRVHQKSHSHQNFSTHRKHFSLGEDYFNVNIAAFRLRQFGNSSAKQSNTPQDSDSSEVKTDPRWQIPRAGRSLILLTERGYYKLATTNLTKFVELGLGGGDEIRTHQPTKFVDWGWRSVRNSYPPTGRNSFAWFGGRYEIRTTD